MIKGYTIRLYPTKEQEHMMWQHVGDARYIWNYMRELQETRYNSKERSGFMKPRFDINRYTDKRCAMVCRNEQEAVAFTRYLDSIGRRWLSGKSYLAETHYSTIGGVEKAYYFNQGTHGIPFETDAILYFNDFLWDDADEENNVETEGWDEFVSSFVLA